MKSVVEQVVFFFLFVTSILITSHLSGLNAINHSLSQISSFSFKSGICLLIAPVPVYCFSITFIRSA